MKLTITGIVRNATDVRKLARDLKLDPVDFALELGYNVGLQIGRISRGLAGKRKPVPRGTKKARK